MAKVRSALKEKLHVLTSSSHKETTPGSRKEHENAIQRMVQQMESYLDPFAEGPARHFKTGVMMDEDVVKGLLNSPVTGEALYKEFVDKRIKETGKDRVDFFKPIRNPKLKTGLEKPKKDSKVIYVLKEEKQAFGVLVGKSTSPYEAHSPSTYQCSPNPSIT